MNFGNFIAIFTKLQILIRKQIMYSLCPPVVSCRPSIYHTNQGKGIKRTKNCLPTFNMHAHRYQLYLPASLNGYPPHVKDTNGVRIG